MNVIFPEGDWEERTAGLFPVEQKHKNFFCAADEFELAVQ